MTTLKEIIAAHPLPWVYRTTPILRGPAQVVVFDASEKVVELFTLLEFAIQVGHGMIRAQDAKPASDASSV